MSTYKQTIAVVTKLLLVHCPKVLTTIITDYCYPVFEKITCDWKTDNKKLTTEPPLDAVWFKRFNNIDFFTVDGVSLGTMPLCCITSLDDFHLVITESKMFVAQLIWGNVSYGWQVTIFETKNSKVGVAGSIIIMTERNALFRHNGNQLAIIERGSYYLLNNEQPIAFNVRVIDTVKCGSLYFVLGVNKNQFQVAVYDYTGRVFLYSFQLYSDSVPLFITATDDHVILLTEDQAGHWIELYTAQGYFISRSVGPSSFERIRARDQHLLIDSMTGCDVYQQVWAID